MQKWRLTNEVRVTNQSSTDACFVIRTSLDPRQMLHARTPTAAPPKCAADETELMPAFCSRVPMSWKRIQRTKTNQAGNRIQLNQTNPQRIRKAIRICGKFSA